MRRFKIILSNSKEAITIQEDELKKVLVGIEMGDPVLVREGIFNPSFFVAIVEDKERERAIAEATRYGGKYEEPSPFAKILSGKLKMLSDQQRSKAQIEASKQERKL